MSEQATEPRHRQGHWLLATSLITTSIALIIISAAVILAVSRPAPWNPLGDYPEQKVNSRVPGHEGPAIRVGEKLSVTGTKCARIDVTVRGGSFWQSVDVPGTFISAGSGIGQRPAKCVTRTFSNPLPLAVEATAGQINGPHQWILTGTETPVRPDGRNEGVPRVWKTEPFEVLP